MSLLSEERNTLQIDYDKIKDIELSSGSELWKVENVLESLENFLSKKESFLAEFIDKYENNTFKKEFEKTQNWFFVNHAEELSEKIFKSNDINEIKANKKAIEDKIETIKETRNGYTDKEMYDFIENITRNDAKEVKKCIANEYDIARNQSKILNYPNIDKISSKAGEMEEKLGKNNWTGEYIDGLETYLKTPNCSIDIEKDVIQGLKKYLDRAEKNSIIIDEKLNNLADDSLERNVVERIEDRMFAVREKFFTNSNEKQTLETSIVDTIKIASLEFSVSAAIKNVLLEREGKTTSESLNDENISDMFNDILKFLENDEKTMLIGGNPEVDIKALEGTDIYSSDALLSKCISDGLKEYRLDGKNYLRNKYYAPKNIVSNKDKNTLVKVLGKDKKDVELNVFKNIEKIPYDKINSNLKKTGSIEDYIKNIRDNDEYQKVVEYLDVKNYKQVEELLSDANERNGLLYRVLNMAILDSYAKNIGGEEKAKEFIRQEAIKENEKRRENVDISFKNSNKIEKITQIREDGNRRNVSMSNLEERTKTVLDRMGMDYTREIGFATPIGMRYFDFMINLGDGKIGAVEINGMFHSMPSKDLDLFKYYERAKSWANYDAISYGKTRFMEEASVPLLILDRNDFADIDKNQLGIENALNKFKNQTEGFLVNHRAFIDDKTGRDIDLNFNRDTGDEYISIGDVIESLNQG